MVERKYASLSRCKEISLIKSVFCDFVMRYFFSTRSNTFSFIVIFYNSLLKIGLKFEGECGEIFF